ncbi:hypothetical protein LSH36_30g03049 [Paralvinella palmiformis]|uniref:Uncharacterized protein n=1 Tax=Paralvinella palmiformis TaxID=53620 RepID=A0AAD9KA21_9ANNE|nr:hypothetical protein LSH36_30g03049 [Paralvinella palmiformis]
MSNAKSGEVLYCACIQVDMVNLLDLQLLNAKESDESESVSTDDEDDGDYKDRVKDILECLDENIDEKKNKDITNDKDNLQDNGNISNDDLRG